MILLARVGSGVYNTLLLLHIVSVLVAFAPAVINPLVGTRLSKADASAARAFSGVAATNTRTVHLPALLAVGILGFAMVGISEEAFKFTDPWVLISAVLWLAIGGIVGAVIAPGERQMAAGDQSAESKVAAAGGIATLLVIVVLFLMVFKPG